MASLTAAAVQPHVSQTHEVPVSVTGNAASEVIPKTNGTSTPASTTTQYIPGEKPINIESQSQVTKPVSFSSSEPLVESITNSNSKCEEPEETQDILIMNGSPDNKAPGPGVDVQTLKKGKLEQYPLETVHKIGDDVVELTSRFGGAPNRISPTPAPASVRRDVSSGLASNPAPSKHYQHEQGDGHGIQAQGIRQKTTPAAGLLTSPAKAKPRSASAKVKHIVATTSERALSATTSSVRKTRTSPLANTSPLGASSLGGLGTQPLRPSSGVFRSTTSFTAKTASPLGQSPKLLPKAPKPLTTKLNPSPNKLKMGDAAAGSPSDKSVSSLKDQFSSFSRFGDSASDGKHITLSNCDKWMKQARVIDGKKITTTDTSIAFKKLFKTQKKVGFDEFKRYVEDLAASKKIEPQEILDKLANAGTPGLSQATKAANASVVERLTDTSKYTGSHKERFDSAGKGKGIVGRREVADNTGYTAAFNEKKKEDAASPAAVAK